VVDGEVIFGTSMVDEAHLTGEPIPVLKNQGTSVYGGSINQDGILHYRATCEVSSSILSKIIKQVEESIASKPRIQVLADSISPYFTLIIVFLAVLTFGLWWGWEQNIDQALMNGIAVLIIGCPCALVLAAPVAQLAGISTLAEMKILLKSGDQMEIAAKVTDVILDKTGTITLGKPEVEEAYLSEWVDPKLLYSLVTSSKHPISQALKRWLVDQYPSMNQQMELDRFQDSPGKGIQAIYQGELLLGGNLDFIQEHQIQINTQQKALLENVENQNKSIFLFSQGSNLKGIFFIHDPIKPESKEAIQKIKDLGLTVHLLTGDRKLPAIEVAKACNINPSCVHAEVNPLEKEAFVQQLRQQGKTIIMVGDGINDTLALSQADIGIAMGSGTETAIKVSDILVLKNDLESVFQVVHSGRTTFRLIKQNFAISLLYNGLAIPLAIAGLVIPLIAAVSMSLSSLLVVGNALRARLSGDV